VLVAALLAGAPGSVSARGGRSYDFNGDGRQDLAAGLSSWADGSPNQPLAGAALVLAGTQSGVSVRPQLFTQSSLGAWDAPSAYDGFGAALASGDFNGDGYADLAVGEPGEKRGRGSGAVIVLFGSPAGLSAIGARLLVGPHDRYRYDVSGFGEVLVAADFNRDGFTDLAAGSPTDRERADGDLTFGSGTVHLLFGSARGLSRARERTLMRPRHRDVLFGFRLAVGDVNHDGRVDLVEMAGADFANHDFRFGRGAFCPGGPRGPVRCRAMPRALTGSVPAPGAVPTPLAIGDVTGDGYADVVEGVPAKKRRAGEILLWRGTRNGPGERPVVIAQNSPGVPGRNQRFDRFGYSVAVGRLDGDRYADIVVGAPGEDQSVGRVTIIRGARSGYARTGNSTLERGSGGMPGPAAQHETFGASLSLLDVNGDHRLDLAVGAPGVAYFSQPPMLFLLLGGGNGDPPFSTATTQGLGFPDLGLTPHTRHHYGTLGSTLGRVGSS
jgi:FG-GAP repeat